MPPLGPPLIYEIYRVYRELQKNGVVNETMLRDLANDSASKNKEEELAILKKKEEVTRKTLIESQAKWTSFCGGIIGMCKTLLDVASNQKKTPPIFFSEISEKLNKYEKILGNNEENYKDIETMYKETFGSQEQHQPKMPEPIQENEEFKPEPTILSQMVPMALSIQFSKLKDFLRTSEDYLKLSAVLQALRWRVSRARHGTQRKDVLQSYIDNDLLECSTPQYPLIVHLINHPKKK